MHGTIDQHGIDRNAAAWIKPSRIGKGNEARRGMRSCAPIQLGPALKEERPFVMMTGLADAAGKARGRRPVRGKELPQRPGNRLDHLLKAQADQAICHPPPGRITIERAPGECRFQEMHMRVRALGRASLAILQKPPERVRMVLLQACAQRRRSAAPACCFAEGTVSTRICEQGESLIIEIEARIPAAPVELDDGAHCIVWGDEIFAEILECVLRGVPPGAVPAEPSRLAIAMRLPGDGPRPVRPRKRTAVEIDCLVKAPAGSIRAHLPPQWQRAAEQPVAQRNRFRGNLLRAAVPPCEDARFHPAGADAGHAKTAIGISCFILHEPRPEARSLLAGRSIGANAGATWQRGRSRIEKGIDVGDMVLVTGAAGFIGMHVARRLLADGHAVLGIDNLNSYYDPGLKAARIEALKAFPRFRFEKMDIADRDCVARLFASQRFVHVVHLAAQAGVRHSLNDPRAYADANLIGFLNILEGCRHRRCQHLLYASSSSVYGANTRMPFRTSDNVDHPLNLYGATKKANELMAHAYAHLFALPATGLRFFTVYGPWGRPDMAMWLFLDAILQGRPIKLFNHGRMRRDFTYIDDVVEAVVRLVPRSPAANPSWSAAAPDPATSQAPWHIYNIGNSQPVEILEVVRLIEQATGRRAAQELLPMQPGDVPETYADVSDLERAVGFRPATSIAEGITRFVDWFREFRNRSAACAKPM